MTHRILDSKPTSLSPQPWAHVLTALATLPMVAAAAGCSSSADPIVTERQQAVTGCSAPQYSAGTYQGGDQVSNAGSEYECKPFPYSGWCGLGGAYEPGVGYAWQDAWILVGACDGSGPSGCSSSADCADGDSCTSDVCNADGSCSNPDNGSCSAGCGNAADCADGDSCTSDVCNADGSCSNPDNGSCGGGGGGGGSTCTAPDWQSGPSYTGGTTVTRNGKEYTAAFWNQNQDPESNNGPVGTGQPWYEGVACGDDGGDDGGGGPTGCGSAADCSDGDSCTSDVCNADGSCSNPDNGSCSTGCSSAADCSDGDSCTSDVCNADGSCSNPDNGSCGGGGGTLADLLSRSTYDQMFPNRNSLYTYDGLIAAARKYPQFAAVGSETVRRREVAAFLANISHETTGGWATAPGGPYSWGLYWIEEVSCAGQICSQYCSSASSYSCVGGKSYHGRGPMQLSWNYNYGQAGDALGINLLSNPDLVTSNSTVAFETALWFWMTTQAPKPSAHDVMVGTWQPSSQDASLGRLPGFGMTINIINGGLECDRPNTAAVTSRLGFYSRYTSLLGTTQGSNVDCAQMAHY